MEPSEDFTKLPEPRLLQDAIHTFIERKLGANVDGETTMSKLAAPICLA